jgi:hypothetical protein
LGLKTKHASVCRFLLERSNEWESLPSKKKDHRRKKKKKKKKKKEQGLKSKRGETSFEKLYVSKEEKK